MDTTTIIILAAACLIMGIVLDNLVRLLLKKEEPVEEKAGPEPVEPRPEQAGPEAEPAKAAPASPAGLAEIARLWDDNDTHGLVVETGGQQIRQPAELSPAQRELLGTALERLAAWLGKPLPAPVSPGGEEKTPQGLPGGVPAADEVIKINREAATPTPPQPVNKVSLNPLDVVVQAIQGNVAKPAEPKSLAEQVDEILQEQLSQSPLRDKEIRLLDVPGKGLVVKVGLENYDGVEAVPDEQIRGLLRAAVDEWGRRTSARKT